MKHDNQRDSPTPITCHYPQGTVESLDTQNTPVAASTCLEKDHAMEVKQITLLKRSSEQQKDGVLTPKLVSKCLSNLGRSGSRLHHVYHFLAVPGQRLNDISIVCNYVHLQKLELPYNNIKDLCCVSHLPNLITLDASHNEISDFFGFKPPKNLKEVNFSYNRMSKMKDLSAYTSLSKLNLDYNSISEIAGLEQCSCITYLSLAHNRISRITGLQNLPLRELCLRANQLERIEGLESVKNLQLLDLSLNRISSLSGLQSLHLLCCINLESNMISDIKEATYIHDLVLLSKLNLQNNPVQEQQDYRLSIIFLLQRLTRLDQLEVTAEEKVSSVNKYDPPPEVVTARHHMTLMVYRLMQPQVLYDSTLPSMASPYPLLVLTGPRACGKRELAHKLCQEFSDYFAYGTCHTTRSPYFGEEDGSDYHFVSEEEFLHMIHMGQFVQSVRYGGYQYGLSRAAVEAVAREGLACCVHMELEGVLSLKNSFFEPRYILLIPTQVERYAQSLRARDLYTQAQIEAALDRIGLYAATNRERPGFFDSVIACDDQDEAYCTLGQVVKEYLGIEGTGDHSKEPTPDPTSTTQDQASGQCSQSASGSKLGPALEPSDPSCRNYWNKLQAQLSPQKTSVELASIQRRERLVREAIVGKGPGAYSQLFTRAVQTESSSDSVVSSTKDKHQLPEDSSSEESHPSSVLSIPSSAGALSEARAPDRASGWDTGPAIEPLKVSLLEQTSQPERLKEDQAPVTSSPETDQLSASSARPGSDARPILPPIPVGRKTPVPPSPTPSPTPKPREGAAPATSASN